MSLAQKAQTLQEFKLWTAGRTLPRRNCWSKRKSGLWG